MRVKKIVPAIKTECNLKITGATLLSVEEAEKLLTQEERAYGKWWWLRSPSPYDCDTELVADVRNRGEIRDSWVCFRKRCVRPALQIKIYKTSNLKIGDTFEVSNYEFKIISNSLAWMYKQDIGRRPFDEDYNYNNDYTTSSVKRFVDNWLASEINIKKTQTT